MSRLVRTILILTLALTAWRVYAIRARLARGDVDPRALEQMRLDLESIPYELGNGLYRGVPLPLSQKTVESAGADVHASRNYADDDGNRFQLYVGGSLRNQENFHGPNYCMPAHGWEVVEQGTVPMRTPPPEQPDATMRRMLLQRGAERMLVYNWFMAGPLVADHEWTIRWYRFLDLLDGAPLRPTIIVTVYATIRGDLKETETAALGFADTIQSILRERRPEEEG